jgi:hypothetical protein
MEGYYRIRIKEGEIEIELEGDKAFVLEKYQELQSLLKAAPKVSIGKPRGRKPKISAAPVVTPIVTETKPKAKRGRKPKAKPEAKPEAPKVKAKRGRKPKAPAEKPLKQKKVVEKPSKKVRADQKDKGLKELVEMKSAKKDWDRIVLAGYYINKNQKKREFRSNDIIAALKKSGLPEPKNTTYHLRKLTEDKGLLMHGRKQGRYKVSDAGVKWVEYN